MVYLIPQMDNKAPLACFTSINMKNPARWIQSNRNERETSAHRLHDSVGGVGGPARSVESSGTSDAGGASPPDSGTAADSSRAAPEERDFDRKCFPIPLAPFFNACVNPFHTPFPTFPTRCSNKKKKKNQISLSLSLSHRSHGLVSSSQHSKHDTNLHAPRRSFRQLSGSSNQRLPSHFACLRTANPQQSQSSCSDHSSTINKPTPHSRLCIQHASNGIEESRFGIGYGFDRHDHRTRWRLRNRSGSRWRSNHRLDSHTSHFDLGAERCTCQEKFDLRF